MAKKKKNKKPNIPVQTLARPRLVKVLKQYNNKELSTDEYIAAIRQLMVDIDQEAILNAMIGLLDGSSNEQKDALMVALPKLGNEQTIEHLWYVVQRSKMTTTSKMTALVILKAMGEEVDLETPEKYFSWRDIKSGNLTKVSQMGQFAIREIVKEMRQQSNINDVEITLLQFQETMSQRSGPLMTLIEDMVNMGNSEAADMLMGLVATGDKAVREAARKSLLKLSAQKVYPQSELIKSLTQEEFHSAYSTDPAHPWQQQVVIIFKRGDKYVQGLHFLLDFGHEWQGAIKDMFPTKTVSFREYSQDFLDKKKQHGFELRQITYSRARQFILDAVEANRKQKIALPPEYHQYNHWLERRIIDPSPEILAKAAEVDANTTDEWGELSEPPLRGVSFITDSEGNEVPIRVLDNLDDIIDDIDWEEDEYVAILDEIVEFYEEEWDIDKEVNLENILPQHLVTDFITLTYDEGHDIEALEERWIHIIDFINFLVLGDDAPASLDAIEEKHISELVVDFWDEDADELEIETDTAADIANRRQEVETMRQFYRFLRDKKHVTPEAAKRVNRAANQLLKHPDKITPLSE